MTTGAKNGGLQEYCSRFQSLHTDRRADGSPRPHKAVMLLPVSEGHALVVSHRPVLSLYELDERMQAEIWDTVRRVREILEERFNPAGFNIGVNDSRAAGQTVSHAHVHIIPRYAGDERDPQGGIRWVLPEKARYWREDGR